MAVGAANFNAQIVLKAEIGRRWSSEIAVALLRPWYFYKAWGKWHI